MKTNLEAPWSLLAVKLGGARQAYEALGKLLGVKETTAKLICRDKARLTHSEFVALGEYLTSLGIPHTPRQTLLEEALASAIHHMTQGTPRRSPAMVAHELTRMTGIEGKP